MSEKPLRRLDTDPVALLCVPSADEGQRILNNYGLDPVVDRVLVITTALDAGMASITYAANTPWTRGEGETADFLASLKIMRQWFGGEAPQAVVFNAQNMEYAIDPRRFNDQ